MILQNCKLTFNIESQAFLVIFLQAISDVWTTDSDTTQATKAPTMNKVSFLINLERNSSNLSYIFILSLKFENLIVGLHVLIISFMLAKF